MESFNTGDTATMRALTAPDYVEHNPAPGQAQGVDGLIKSCMDIRVGFPDIKVSVEDVVVSGDMIAIRSRMTGTFTNAFAGMKPNGKKMDVEAIDLMRIKDGKQVEHWGLFDIMAMMTQLEMMPNADDASSSAATAPSGDQQTASDSGK